MKNMKTNKTSKVANLSSADFNKKIETELLPIIQQSSNYSLTELKSILTNILINPNGTAASKKASRYINSMRYIDTLPKIQLFMSEIYLSSVGLNAIVNFKSKK